MSFYRTEETEDGKWIEDKETVIKLKANFIISAFGSTLNDTKGTHFPLIL